jgi:nucleotide-binding universal stress UspA family protein
METTHSHRSVASTAFDARAVFERVLVPVDFSEGSRRALATALELKRCFGSEVHLFRLTESSENDRFLAGSGAEAMSPHALVTQAEERLRRFVDNVLPGRSGDVVAHAQVGADVVHAIARNARKLGTTLVVLAEAPKQTVFRTQMEKIVQELDGAVMILRTELAAPH